MLGVNSRVAREFSGRNRGVNLVPHQLFIESPKTVDPDRLCFVREEARAVIAKDLVPDERSAERCLRLHALAVTVLASGHVLVDQTADLSWPRFRTVDVDSLGGRASLRQHQEASLGTHPALPACTTPSRDPAAGRACADCTYRFAPSDPPGMLHEMSVRRNTIEQHQRPDLGLRIPEEAREALIKVLVQRQLANRAIELLCSTLAVGEPAQIPQHMVRTFGNDAAGVAAATAACIESPISGGISMEPASQDGLALLKAPDWYFLRFLEAGFEAILDTYGYQHADLDPVYDQLRTALNRTLQGAGGVYTIDENHKAVLVGEELLDSEVLRPALQALAQPEMRRVDQDLQAALQGLAAGDQAGFERAITQGAAAVEGTLAVLIDRHGVTATGTGAAKYFEALKTAGILANHFRPLVIASAEIRNKEAGHSSQTTPRGATAESARAAVYSACVAVTYLCTKLERD